MGPYFHFRRPQKPNTSTPRSTRVGTLGGSTPRGFAAFFHSLPPPSNATGTLSPSQKCFRFFARDQGNFFSSHGPEARDLAARFYSTQTVVRSQGGLSSLSISRKLFASRVLPSLLASGAAVEIWEQAAGEGSEQEEWFVARAGRPGDTRALEDVMLAFSGQGASQAEQEASSLIGTGVTMAVLVQEGGAGRGAVFGVAVANTSFRTLALGELEDAGDPKTLESLVVQVGARECLVLRPEDGAKGAQAGSDAGVRAVAAVMARCGVVHSVVEREGPRGNLGESVSALKAIRALAEGRDKDLGGADTPPTQESEFETVLSQLAPLKRALLSAHALLSHLGLLPEGSGEGGGAGGDGEDGWEVSLLKPEHVLQYDAAAARALAVLPEAGRAEARYRGGEGAGGRQQQPSLYSILNKTRTAAGSRCLKRWLQAPLLAPAAIRDRQSIVSLFRSDPSLLSALHECYGASSLTGRGAVFRGTPDLERTAQRFLSLPTSSASSPARPRVGLRDLLEVYTAALTLGRLSDALSSLADATCPALDALLRLPLARVVAALARFQALVEEVVDVDRLVSTHGREVAVKPSFDPLLLSLRDQMEALTRRMEDTARRASKDLYGQAKDADKRVKLDWSAVHQHHLRVTKKDQRALKESGASLQIQTLSVQKHGQLFTTPSLKELSRRWAAHQAEYLQVQEALVAQAVSVGRSYVKQMQRGGRLLAAIDVFLSLAQVANELNWCPPTLLDDKDGTRRELHITQLRHPVVEAALPSAADFIPNDVHLSAASPIRDPPSQGSCLSLVTGPNCGGKSTYIRSVGIAVLLAQVGACVPATAMEWTLIDKVLCRVGASDNQLQGVSTFMAEMLETHALLAAATPRSLVIVDELGRGTSTFDGFGLAWAVAERLANSTAMQCRTLFATHFHELCDMEQALPPGRVQNLHFSAETPASHPATAASSDLVLTYRVRPGPCDRSFGVHVARLAKFPEEIVREAAARVEALQAGGLRALTSEQQARLAEKKRAWEDEEEGRLKRARAAARARQRKAVEALAALPSLEDVALGEALEGVVALVEANVK